jgi:hypothetical protein
MRHSKLTLVTLLLAVAPAVANASVANDQVLSQHIRDADGTSGQNTSAGSGIKTGHIQDGAVTASKLGIYCLDGYYLQYTLFGGWTCSVGTPGPAGPQGPIGPQGATGPVGPQGQAGAAPSYANVVVVALSGGDFTDLGSALASITGATASNPWVVKVMPGVYGPGPTPIVLKSHVAIEGSGSGVTRIVAPAVPEVETTLISASGIVNVELRDIGIEWEAGKRASNVGLFPVENGLRAENSEIRLSRVSVKVTGSASHKTIQGIYASASTIAMDEVVVEAITVPTDSSNFWGIVLTNSTGFISDSRVKISNPPYGSSVAFYMIDGDVTITGSRLFGEGFAVHTNNNDPNASLKILDSTLQSNVWALDLFNLGGKIIASGSQLAGRVGVNGNSPRLLGCFDEAFNSIPNQ